MWELDYTESWVPKNWCFWTLELEKTLESPLDSNVTQPVHPKGNQSWIVVQDVEAETTILWPPAAKNWLIWKDPDDGKDWRWRRRGQQRMRWWMASLTQCTWVWVNSGSWWTGRPGALQSMGSQSQTLLSDWTECFCSHAELSIPLSLSFPHWGHKSVLSVCVSTAALKIGCTFQKYQFISEGKRIATSFLKFIWAWWAHHRPKIKRSIFIFKWISNRKKVMTQLNNEKYLF